MNDGSAAMNTSFYDRLAPFYHLLYADWDGSVERQGAALSALLRELGVMPGSRVLDAACGIGTQAIGLAEHGYRVTASDVSPRAVARARTEFERRSLSGEFTVADLRDLSPVTTEPVAAVVACDNAVPHLLSDTEILTAFRSCYERLMPGGVLVISVRDYATIERRSPDMHPYGLRRHGNERFLAVQVWEWEGDQYDIRLYLTREWPDGACATKMLRSRYYAVTVARLMELLHEAGFVKTARRDGVLFQPVLIGVRGDP